MDHADMRLYTSIRIYRGVLGESYAPTTLIPDIAKSSYG